MILPVPAAPLPPIEPAALAAGPSLGSADGGGPAGGADFGASLNRIPDEATALHESTRATQVLETPQALRELVREALAKGPDMQPVELIALQLRVHEMSFQLESVSKAIEHGMSGTKTLLQTQA